MKHLGGSLQRREGLGWVWGSSKYTTYDFLNDFMCQADLEAFRSLWYIFTTTALWVQCAYPQFEGAGAQEDSLACPVCKWRSWELRPDPTDYKSCSPHGAKGIPKQKSLAPGHGGYDASPRRGTGTDTGMLGHSAEGPVQWAIVTSPQRGGGGAGDGWSRGPRSRLEGHV